MSLNRIRTNTLEIAFDEGGSVEGPPIILLHGWPDAPCGWDVVTQHLQNAGYRTIVPYLRGSTPTEFLSAKTPRIGSGIALAQDAIDLADSLGLDKFVVIGHDWGARAAYTLAALFPKRVLATVALALAYQPRGIFKVPSFEQSRRFWYQWFLCTDGGAEKVRKDPIGFARIQWETWSPPGWFDAAEFVRTAASFSSADWASITLNAYRSRWRQDEASDSRYDTLQQRLSEVECLSTPTLMIQGLSDFCDPLSESKGLEEFFTGAYERIELEGVGHFPHREAPELVAEAVLNHLRDRTKS